MTVESKVVPQEETAEEGKARREKLVNMINLSVLQSVAQHMITLQSEPLLMDAICNGDRIASSQLLSNSAGIVGILSIIVNQIGGKVSDAIGRKAALLVGPIGNMILGALVYANPTNKLLVLVCRILRQSITTFSNTVVIGAMIGDALPQQEQAIAGAKIGATVGIAVSLVPFVEGTILARSQSPRFTFLLLSALGAIQVLNTATSMPETLEKPKRKKLDEVLTLSTLNPFGFTQLFSRASTALRKNVCVTTMQGFLEGKNLSDFGMVFMKENLQWGVTEIRNFISLYGLCCVISNMKLTPYLLKNLSVRQYTNATNFTNTVAYLLRAFGDGRPWVFLGTIPIMLPGVNGLSRNALGAVATSRAMIEGFGMGEFSAYCNNLRAVISALAPVIMTNFYAYFQKRGFGGATYWLACLIGAIIPGLMFQQMKDDELKAS